MKYLNYLIMFALLMTMASCDFKNPVETLKPDERIENWKPKTKEPVYRKQVIRWWPDKYVQLTDEELRGLIDAPPPDPRHEIKEWLTLLAKIATGLGLLGMLIAAVLFVYQNPVWDDLGIVSAVAFCGGLTIAISYNLIVVVVPIMTLCVVGYFIYVIYNKHVKNKDTESLIEAFDLISEMGDEGNKVQEALKKAGIVTERIENRVKKSLKKRNGTREKQIKQLEELLADMSEA
jgi:hypothetical protein